MNARALLAALAVTAAATAPIAAADTCLVHPGVRLCWRTATPYGLPYAVRLVATGQGGAFHGTIPWTYYAEASAGSSWPTGDARAFGILFVDVADRALLTAALADCDDMNRDGAPDRCYLQGPPTSVLP